LELVSPDKNIQISLAINGDYLIETFSSAISGNNITEEYIQSLVPQIEGDILIIRITENETGIVFEKSFDI
jgi:hypothetical protein